MDLYCPRCGEPWDNDEFHSAEYPYRDAVRRFRKEGCGVFGVNCEKVRTGRGEATAALMDLMPDDMDGVMSALDDGLWMEFDND
jgi:hypothetical protein